MDKVTEIRRMLKDGKPVFGIFMKTCDPAFVECAGFAGMDFAILDMEHGPVDFMNLQNLIRGAEVSGLLPVVRTYDASETAISKALDLGAGGIQVPQICSIEEGKAVVEAARFYPKGNRGVCRFVRAAKYSAMAREEYFREADKPLIIMQVEGRQVLDDLDGILSIEGLDILFIGPYDLSQSLGVPGQVSHPDVVRAIMEINDKARCSGVTTGVFCDTKEALELWYDAGIRYLSYSVDVGIFTSACRSLVSEMKSVIGKKESANE